MRKLGITLAVAMAISAPVLADSISSANKTQSGMDLEAARTQAFTGLDANSDGYIDRDEAVGEAGLTVQLERLDTDGDGRLSATEYHANTTLNSDHGFATLDTNGDGYVSREEAEANQEMSSRWSTLDQDADGRLDSSEFARFEPGEMPKHPMDKATGIDLRPGVTTEGKKN